MLYLLVSSVSHFSPDNAMKSVMKNFYRRDAEEKKSIYFLKTLGLLCVEMQYETMSFHHTEDLITELLLILTERIIKGTIVLSP